MVSTSVLERYRIDTEVLLGTNFLEDELSGRCRIYGRRGLLVFGTGSSVPDERRSAILRYLESKGFATQVVSGACADITLNELKKLSGEVINRHDWVAAIGGGSVIDIGKVLSLRSADQLAVQASQTLADLIAGLGSFETVPMIAVPTCIGSGAEVSALADVLVNEEGVRVPLISPALYPVAALIDCSLPPPPSHIQFATIVDAATHILDPWLNVLGTPVPQQDMTVALLRSLIKLARELPGQRSSPEVMCGLALMSHLALRQGLARPSAHASSIHRIEHVLSPLLGWRHGESLAALLPPFLQWMESLEPSPLIQVADYFAEIFGRFAMPSVLVTEWLTSLPLERRRIDMSESAVRDVAHVVIQNFGDERRLLPGNLSIGQAEVEGILRLAFSPGQRIKSPKARLLDSSQNSVNQERVFGGQIRRCHVCVLMTPIPAIFNELGQLFGVSSKPAWFPTIELNLADGNSALLVLLHPGGGAAKDFLGLLARAGIEPGQLLFIGLAGALTEDNELKIGDVVCPTFVHPSERLRNGAPAVLESSLNRDDLLLSGSWTVRSAPSLTDETIELLKAWRWIGVDLVDLECSSLATYCAAKEIPLRVFLIVSDFPAGGDPIWNRKELQADDELVHSIRRLATYLTKIVTEPRCKTSGTRANKYGHHAS